MRPKICEAVGRKAAVAAVKCMRKEGNGLACLFGMERKRREVCFLSGCPRRNEKARQVQTQWENTM